MYQQSPVFEYLYALDHLPYYRIVISDATDSALGNDLQPVFATVITCKVVFFGLSNRYSYCYGRIKRK